MKKTSVTAIFLSTLLVATMAEACLNFGEANFMPFHNAPSTDPPSFTLMSPKTHSWERADQLNFKIAKPSSWFNGWVSGEIISINYTVDQNPFSIDVGSRLIDTGGLWYDVDGLAETSLHSISLAELADGQHIIELNVTAVTFYNPEEDYWTVHRYGMLVSEKIELSINTSDGATTCMINSITEKVYPDKTPPTISVLSPKNVEYNAQILLNYSIDEETSWVGYSLDNQANVTLTGNTALVNVSDGTHCIVVYANDTAGNMGDKTVSFSVNPFLYNLVGVVVLVVTVACFGLTVYTKRCRKKTGSRKTDFFIRSQKHLG